MAKTTVPKTRNAGTMTESAFWTWIYYALRRRSMFWKPIQQVKEAARRAYTGTQKNRKWEYQCAMCKEWFPAKEVIVDHIHGTGGLKTGEQLHEFVERLFCEAEHLRVLCNEKCHKEITYKPRRKQHESID